MTQKIKLMSDDEVSSLIKRIYDKNKGQEFALKYTHILHQEVRDECEKRATEKMREAAFKAWEARADNYSGFAWGTGTVKSFDNWFQQFLKEQDDK